MTDARENEKAQPLKWPLEWWRDEKFWRDVASRALAGLIVVALTGLVALVSGLLNDPVYQSALFRLFGLIVVAVIWTPLSSRVISRVKQKRGMVALILTSLCSLGVLLGLLWIIGALTAPGT
ncbi:hypothetical protein [Mycetocola zhujimingii]|uniref:hypothetical protein n=1 Tax=Mycetocola zhujimingii TaxID=2079792 RepID=UPI0011B2185B|nr:hypothetical protein [Mycetocola zhujimingii]